VKSILMALRNLNRQKKRSFLLGGAIAFGLMIVTIINGFTGSFVQNVDENFSHLFAGHIFITGTEKLANGRRVSIIRDDALLTAAIRSSGIPIEYLTKSSQFRGTLIFQNNSVSQQVVGTNWSQASYIRDRLVLTSGSFENMSNPKGIIISQKIAEKLKAQVGDTILAQMQTATGQMNVGEFAVAAISYDPGLFGSISAYANREYVNELLNIAPSEYQTLGIFVKDMSRMDSYAATLYKALSTKVSMFARNESGGAQSPFAEMLRQAKDENWTGTRYTLYTLNDLLSQMKQIVSTIDVTGLVILLILFVIIMVGITNTFRMIMYERIREIGTMRALGMQRSRVRNLFLLEALFLSIGGMAAGLIAAGIIMAGLHLINFGLNTPFYLLLKNGHMTFSLSPIQVILKILLIALLTLVAALLPARSAARLTPADALRSTH